MSSYLLLSTLNFSLGGLVFLLGFIILRENPRHRLNRIVALMLFFGGVGAFLAAASFLAARAGTRTASTAHLIENLSYVWEFYFPALFLFASHFPERRGFTRRPPLLAGRPWAPGFGTLLFLPHTFHFLLAVAISIGVTSVKIPQVGLLRYADSILSIGGVILGLFLLVHRALFSLVNLGFGLAAVALLVGSLRRATVPRLRQQLRVITVGLTASLVCYSFATIIPPLFNWALREDVRAALTIAALTLGPGSIAYSVVRHKFLDTRLLARRAILYALASGALVGVYLAVVQPLGRLVASSSGMDLRVIDPVLLVMALALFQPAIGRLEELVDHMLLRDPSDHRNVLRQLGRDLQTTIDLEELLSRTVRTVSDTLLLRRAHVVVITPGQAVAHTGAGAPVPPETLQRLGLCLPRVSARQTSYRMSDRVDGLSREEQDQVVAAGATLLVPLRWREELVGALLLGDKLTGTPYTSEDVQLLTTLAGQVAVSLQNALLLRDRVAVARVEEEMNLARQIQRTSLLSEFPHIPRCEVHAVYQPSRHVGGDFYDVVPTGDGSFLMAIADVSGKGMPAALLSAMLQASLRTQSSAAAEIPQILRNINTLLYRSTAIQQFATFFLARLDAASLRLTFSNAGHNWPVILRKGSSRIFLEKGGTILGILENAQYEEAEVLLVPGDVVVFYTDGVNEAQNALDQQFGEERIYQIVESLAKESCAREVAERLLGSLGEFLDGVEPQDDITLLVLRVLEPSEAQLDPRAEPEAVAAG
ncbi:MAG: GAF domain-containing SpoIIE family protein phosphatase [Candidatus Eisenbacteria bacterium]